MAVVVSLLHFLRTSHRRCTFVMYLCVTPKPGSNNPYFLQKRWCDHAAHQAVQSATYTADRVRAVAGQVLAQLSANSAARCSAERQQAQLGADHADPLLQVVCMVHTQCQCPALAFSSLAAPQADRGYTTSFVQVICCSKRYIALQQHDHVFEQPHLRHVYLASIA